MCPTSTLAGKEVRLTGLQFPAPFPESFLQVADIFVFKCGRVADPIGKNKISELEICWERIPNAGRQWLSCNPLTAILMLFLLLSDLKYKYSWRIYISGKIEILIICAITHHPEKKLSMFNLLKINQNLCISRVSWELNFLKVKSVAKSKII